MHQTLPWQSVEPLVANLLTLTLNSLTELLFLNHSDPTDRQNLREVSVSSSMGIEYYLPKAEYIKSLTSKFKLSIF